MHKNVINSYSRLLVIPLMAILAACSPLMALSRGGNSQAPTQIVSSSSENPSVTVKDQETDGLSVIVADAVSQGPGWIAIHNQVNGNIGEAIGEAHLSNGDNKNVLVKIDPAQATAVMYAMLHIDAGTVGKYEFPGPDVPIQVNGQMLSPSFKFSLLSAASSTATPVGGSMGMSSSSQGGMTPSVKVSDQALNGDSVVVDDVVSSGPGWIVIYTTDASGQPDQPIGHAVVKDGDNQMVMVPVDPGKAKGSLYAQLLADKGTVGTFDYPGADEPVMLGVQMIAGAFKIISGSSALGPATPSVLQPSISVSDQEIQNGTVTVAQVVSNGNWWLVIHRQNPDGTMGEYIGQTLVKNGINTNVVVSINLKLATPVLYAMLHEDNAPFGILEFPGSDVPVMLNGEMIAPSFNVTGLAQDVTINIHKVSDTVSFLVDGVGKSLYLSLQDTPGKSNCTADCLTVWKPVLVDARVIAGSGVVQANLGVIVLPNGTHQVTYLGAPLYTYIKDINPGDTNGQGVGGVWFLVTP
jgi:predicted lipoprotein with Yx(FWY)xxD motif